MGLFTQRHKQVENRVEELEDVIDELVLALMNGEEDVDLRLAELVEDEQELVRIAIVEKMREKLQAQDESKAKELDQIVEQQKLLEKQRKHQNMQQWLAYVMSQDTLRKIREALLHTPGLAQQLQHIGQDLAKKGVFFNMNPNGKKDIGELSASVQHQQDQRRKAGKGL
ncbi:MAG: MICOS complex subunit MIC60 [Rickettsiales bacterium]|nr:MICOS complex subunit MIC60 [Rickettsiales bacterium]